MRVEEREVLPLVPASMEPPREHVPALGKRR